MKHRIMMLLATIVFLLCSCNDAREPQYQKYMSYNEAYEVEIPIDFTEFDIVGSESIDDLLAFTQEKTRSFIIIQSLDESESLSQFAEKNNSRNNFNYSVVQQTDTSRYYKITKGTTMWCAYQLYMKKNLDEKQYVISVSSDVLDKDVLIAMIEHVQKSLSAHSTKMEVIEGLKDNDGNNMNGAFVTRNTNYYSIDYPKEWKVLINPDQMTDVYLGDSEGKIGCTILFFDTDYTLSELNEESNVNMKNDFAAIISNTKISIGGQPCYKSIYEFTIGDTRFKQVSYLFKKDGTMFNVKFGNDKIAIDKNIALIEKIISTFKIK